jgi:hypothetical protein
MEHGPRHEDGRTLLAIRDYIRSPLVPLRNALCVLELQCEEAGTREWAWGLLDWQVHRMARLIKELLEASPRGQGQVLLRRERMDLSANGTVVKPPRKAADRERAASSAFGCRSSKRRADRSRGRREMRGPRVFAFRGAALLTATCWP